eukprot:SAG11_NODE_14546_length_608_cov_1.011788_1_plen_51_part_01
MKAHADCDEEEHALSNLLRKQCDALGLCPWLANRLLPLLTATSRFGRCAIV